MSFVEPHPQGVPGPEGKTGMQIFVRILAVFFIVGALVVGGCLFLVGKGVTERAKAMEAAKAHPSSPKPPPASPKS